MSLEYGPSQAETEGFRAPAEQNREQHETLLQDNDLQVPERQIGESKELLEKLKINFESILLYKSQPLKEGGESGGQYILRIGDPKDKEQPASIGYLKEVFQYLKLNGITVSAGRPEVARN